MENNRHLGVTQIHELEEELATDLLRGLHVLLQLGQVYTEKRYVTISTILTDRPTDRQTDGQMISTLEP